MRTPKLWTISFFLILSFLIFYPTGRALLSMDYNIVASTSPQCKFSPYRTLEVFEFPIYIFCFVVSTLRSFHQCIVAFIVGVFRHFGGYEEQPGFGDSTQHAWPKRGVAGFNYPNSTSVYYLNNGDLLIIQNGHGNLNIIGHPKLIGVTYPDPSNNTRSQARSEDIAWWRRPIIRHIFRDIKPGSTETDDAHYQHQAQKRSLADVDKFIPSRPLQPNPPECNGKVPGRDMAECTAKVAHRDMMYVIVASIAALLACLLFAFLIIRYVRARSRRASKNCLKKEESPVTRVGLGRGLGSDGPGMNGRVRFGDAVDVKRELCDVMERDLELGDADMGNSAGLIDSSWKSPITRRSSSGWKRLLRVGPSASMELKENTNYLAPPPSQIPPRIPTPKLPGSLNASRMSFFNDSIKSRLGFERKPVAGVVFDEEAATTPMGRPGLVIPEIRVISTGSTY